MSDHASPWTAEELPDAYRDAIAMALAGWRHDGEGIAALWNGTPNKQALIYALSRLPAVLLAAEAASSGEAVDPEAVLSGLLDNLPLFIDPEEESK